MSILKASKWSIATINIYIGMSSLFCLTFFLLLELNDTLHPLHFSASSSCCHRTSLSFWRMFSSCTCKTTIPLTLVILDQNIGNGVFSTIQQNVWRLKVAAPITLFNHIVHDRNQAGAVSKHMFFCRNETTFMMLTKWQNGKSKMTSR